LRGQAVNNNERKYKGDYDSRDAVFEATPNFKVILSIVIDVPHCGYRQKIQEFELQQKTIRSKKNRVSSNRVTSIESLEAIR